MVLKIAIFHSFLWSSIPLCMYTTSFLSTNLSMDIWIFSNLGYCSVQFSSIVSDSLRPHELQHARLPCPPTVTWVESTQKPMSIELVMPSNHLILCCPFFLLPSIFPRVRVFPNESVIHVRWPKYWSFSFSISTYDEYSVLISFRMD